MATSGVDRDRDEQQRQVRDRVAVEPDRPGRRALLRRPDPPQPVRLPDEDRAEDERRPEVDRAHPGHREQDERDRHQQEGVERDLAGRLGDAPDHRQHRDPGSLVVLPDPERQRPEMGRRPVEDDREQDERREGHRAGDRGPTDDRRQRAGRAADDDVLRGRPLEHDRVDDDVEGDRQQGQEGGHEVDEPGHHDERDRAEDDPEDDRPLGLDLVGRQRPAAGPDHELVDVAVEVAVDRVRAASGQRAADERPQDEPAPLADPEARHVAGGEDHRRDGRDEEELDDPRLGQRDVGPQRVARGRGRAGRSTLAVAGRDTRPGAGNAHGGRHPSGVVGRHGEGAGQGPHGSPEGDVEGLRPGRQLGQDLEPADDRLGEVEDRRGDGQPDDRAVLALGPQGGDRDGGDDEPDDDRDPAVEDVGRRQRRSAAGRTCRP